MEPAEPTTASATQIPPLPDEDAPANLGLEKVEDKEDPDATVPGTSTAAALPTQGNHLAHGGNPGPSPSPPTSNPGTGSHPSMSNSHNPTNDHHAKAGSPSSKGGPTSNPDANHVPNPTPPAPTGPLDQYQQVGYSMQQWMTALNPGKMDVSWEYLGRWGPLRYVGSGTLRQVIAGGVLPEDNRLFKFPWRVTGWVMPASVLLTYLPLNWPACWSGIRGHITGLESVYLCLNLLEPRMGGVDVEFGKFLYPSIYQQAVTTFLSEQVKRVTSAVAALPDRPLNTYEFPTPFHALLHLLRKQNILKGHCRLHGLPNALRHSLNQEALRRRNLRLDLYEPVCEQDILHESGEAYCLFPNYDWVSMQQERAEEGFSNPTPKDNLLLLRLLESIGQPFKILGSGLGQHPAEYQVGDLETFLERKYWELAASEEQFVDYLWEVSLKEWANATGQSTNTNPRS